MFDFDYEDHGGGGGGGGGGDDGRHNIDAIIRLCEHVYNEAVRNASRQNLCPTCVLRMLPAVVYLNLMERVHDQGDDPFKWAKSEVMTMITLVMKDAARNIRMNRHKNDEGQEQ